MTLDRPAEDRAEHLRHFEHGLNGWKSAVAKRQTFVAVDRSMRLGDELGSTFIGAGP